MNKIKFRNINFLNLEDKDFNKIIKNKGLFVFPSAPGLASINEHINYYESLKNADYVFFDSSFFVLLIRFLKNIKVQRFSGFKFLSFFFKYLKLNKDKIIFCIDPNIKFSRTNKKFLNKNGVTKVYNYVAPHYEKSKIIDQKLLKMINDINPDFIMTNIGGGIQEVLGLYLKKNMIGNSTIICTGGAISFFTGDQAPINKFIDKFYLGWLVRLIYNPKVFYKRFIYAFKLFPMVLLNKVQK